MVMVMKKKTVNFTYVAYLPVAAFSIWQFVDSNSFVLGALAGAAATVVAMHCRDHLDRLARNDATQDAASVKNGSEPNQGF